jgi:hypothetical protein
MGAIGKGRVAVGLPLDIHLVGSSSSIGSRLGATVEMLSLWPIFMLTHAHPADSTSWMTKRLVVATP